jgi:uncharacterized protein YbaP (TraB family)
MYASSAAIRKLPVIAALWLAISSSLNALPLWEIQGTDNKIFLLGSVHFLRAQDYPLPSKINEVYENADIVVMEIDLAGLDLIQTQALMQSMSVDPDGKNLQDLLGSRTFREAQALAQDIDIDLEYLMPFEPWFAALQITQLRLMKLGFDGSFGIDSHFTVAATRDQKPILGLETLEFQLGMMDSLPEQVQRDFLLQTLEDAVDAGKYMDEIVDAWRAGDTRTLEERLLSDLDDQPELYDQMLVRRNKNWTRSIVDYANDDEDYLIIVGALHLVGKDSVIRLLKKEGLTATQIH